MTPARKDPRFSIIMVTYNAASTVERTVESVSSQTCDDYEHIIVDGLSADATVENALKACKHSDKLMVIQESDNGIYDAMNKGIREAHGKYLLFLNAGDKFHSPQTLQMISDCIDSGNQPDIVYGQTNLVDDSGAFVAPRHLTAPAELTFRDFASGMLVCHQAFVVRKDIAPLYDLQYKLSADYDWCIRCLQQSQRNEFIDSVLIDYLSEGMTTANRKKSLKERYRIMIHYYGFWSTILRHVWFAMRFLRNKLFNIPS